MEDVASDAWLMSIRQEADQRDARVGRAIEAIAGGQFVIVVDDEDRENEGDLVLAADAATPERLAFMIKHTSGLVCVPLTLPRVTELQLPQMVAHSTEAHGTAFTHSVDYRVDTTTGISAADRAATVRALAAPSQCGPGDFTRPGHVFPLLAREGGVLERAGHTEAAIDLTRLAGRYPAGVIAELVSADGAMMRAAGIETFAQARGLSTVSIADLIGYRRRYETTVVVEADTRLPTRHGEFRCVVYRSPADGSRVVALVAGAVAGQFDVTVRVHSECLTGDVFASRRCDCGEQLDAALSIIADEGRGVLLYMLGHEGRGIGLANKLLAYQLQAQGHDTVDANLKLGLPVDARDYNVGAEVLRALGVRSARLLTNNPAKLSAMVAAGLWVERRLPLVTAVNPDNLAYLRSKQTRMGHALAELPTSLTSRLMAPGASSSA